MSFPLPHYFRLLMVACVLYFVHCLIPLFHTGAMAVENGILFVYPEPVDAEVKIKGLSRDYFPGIGLAPGAYRVQVSKAGYDNYQKEVYVESREIYDLFVELKKSRRWTDPETGIDLIWVPEGCFSMGCGPWAADCQPDEKPEHRVCVDGFWMSKYEITQGVWEKIMGDNPSRFQKGSQYPVERVSWHKAAEFVSRLKMAGGYKVRLPTEAEWEYAARAGGRKEIYAGGGDNLPALGWYQSNSQNSTHPVGEKKPNVLGLHDMSGNVWEWCQDVYAKDAYSPGGNNSSDKDHSVFRVRRGGSWESGKQHLRTLFRGRYPADLHFESNGLRIVVVPDSE